MRSFSPAGRPSGSQAGRCRHLRRPAPRAEPEGPAQLPARVAPIAQPSVDDGTRQRRLSRAPLDAAAATADRRLGPAAPIHARVLSAAGEGAVAQPREAQSRVSVLAL